MTISPPRAETPTHAAHKTGALSPADRDVLWNMEERFWTGSAENARATTASNAVMIFPYPPGILQGDRIWPQIEDRTGWRSVEMIERRSTRRGDIAVLTYRVSAEKAEVPITKALCASTYVHDDDRWVRVSHQQTPVS